MLGLTRLDWYVVLGVSLLWAFFTVGPPFYRLGVLIGNVIALALVAAAIRLVYRRFGQSSSGGEPA